MKKIMGFLSLVLVLAVANASVLDTSDMLLMAYYQDRCLDGGIEDLSTVAEEYDTITESTPQYIEGKIKITQNTSSLEYTTVHVRTRTDGWIVAWLPSTTEHILGDIPKWDTKTNSAVSTTTIENAINRIISRVGHTSCTVEASPYTYSGSHVTYYSGIYPSATNLVITGSYDYSAGKYAGVATTWYVTKHGVTTYNSALCYTGWLGSGSNNRVEWNETFDPSYTTVASNVTQILCTNTTSSMIADQKYRAYTYGYSYRTYGTWIKAALISIHG